MPHPAIDRGAVRAQWARSGFSCALWIDPPGRVWHDFQHDVDERILLLEGELQVDLPTGTVRLGPGSALDIPAGTRHTVRNSLDQPARWLYGYRQLAPSQLAPSREQAG